jgi:hypothetical protein
VCSLGVYTSIDFHCDFIGVRGIVLRFVDSKYLYIDLCRFPWMFIVSSGMFMGIHRFILCVYPISFICMNLHCVFVDVDCSLLIVNGFSICIQTLKLNSE